MAVGRSLFPEVGWAIGDGQERWRGPRVGMPKRQTLCNALLESEVVPEFYERDESGMPGKWLGHIRESMARLTPEFSATRAIREYTGESLLPAASRYRDRASDDGASARAAANGSRTLSGIEHGAFRRQFESTPTTGSTSSKRTLILAPSLRIT